VPSTISGADVGETCTRRGIIAKLRAAARRLRAGGMFTRHVCADIAPDIRGKALNQPL
jgi:hypothetical protein